MTSTDPTLLFLLSEDARATDLVRLLSKEKVHQPGDGIIGGVDVTPNGPSTLECGVDTTGAKSGAYRVAVVQFRDRGGEIAISDDAFVIWSGLGNGMWDTSRRHAGATVAPALPSVPDLLQAIRGGIDDSLVSPSAFEKLIATAASLPPTHSGASLECHLGLATERVDLVVRLFASDRAAFLEPSSDPADLQLESVRRFVSAWAQKDKQLSQVPYADLELDLEGSSRGCIVGAMIEPSFHEGVAAVLRRQSQSRGTVSSFAIAAQALEATDSEPADAKVLDGVRRCFEALGRDAFIAHVGSLRSRVEGRGDLVS